MPSSLPFGVHVVGARADACDVDGSDAAKTIKVRVTFTDDAGNGESLTIEESGAVSAFHLSGIATTDYEENGT